MNKSRSHNKKRRYARRANQGEIAGQVFVYILGIVVVALILLLGARALSTINTKKCDVQDVRFQTDLENAIEQNKGRGVVRTASVTLPCEVDQVCFVSRNVVDAITLTSTRPTVLESFKNVYGSIVSSVEADIDNNVFVRTPSGYEAVPKFDKAAPIELPQDKPIACITGEKGGKVTIRFEGTGRAVTPNPV